MKSMYVSLLSIVIGWSVLAFVTDINWIAYIALAIGFIGIISEKFAQKFTQFTHSIFQFIFNWIQRLLLTFIYIFVFTPISILKKDDKKSGSFWLSPEKQNKSQLKNLW